MTKTRRPRMQAPEGLTNATIEGHGYEVDEKGQIEVATDNHIETLKRHGFTDIVESNETADEIMEMDPQELTEYIEERGGTVPEGIKRKKLRGMALRTGGFITEADALDKGSEEAPKPRRRNKK